MKFHEGIIIKGKFMNRNKIFACLRNMQNVFKHNIMIMGVNGRVANMRNVHNLISSSVLALHGELVKIAGDVVRGTRVQVPTGIDAIGIGSHINIFLFTSEGVIEPLPTLQNDMVNLATQLTLRSVVVVVGAAPTTTREITPAVTTTSLASWSTTTACGRVSRGLMIVPSLKNLKTEFMTQHLRQELAGCDRFNTRSNGGHNRVVVHVKPSKDIGSELLKIKLLASRFHLIC
jgi:hypothetical protein